MGEEWQFEETLYLGKKKLVKGLDYMNKRNGVSKRRKRVIFEIVSPKEEEWIIAQTLKSHFDLQVGTQAGERQRLHPSWAVFWEREASRLKHLQTDSNYEACS